MVTKEDVQKMIQELRDKMEENCADADYLQAVDIRGVERMFLDFKYRCLDRLESLQVELGKTRDEIKDRLEEIEGLEEKLQTMKTKLRAEKNLIENKVDKITLENKVDKTIGKQ